MPLDMELGLGPGDCVRWGPTSLSPERGQSLPQFSAHVYCDQTVGWIKMALCTEIGPGHIVLDGDPAPLPKGTQPPIFGPYLLWPNGWMD